MHWLSVDAASGARSAVVTPDGDAGSRKHPVLAASRDGHVLLLWTEGTGWNKGGRLAWQRFDASGRPLPTSTETISSRLVDAGALVSGRVLNADGTPVPNAEVLYFNSVPNNVIGVSRM